VRIFGSNLVVESDRAGGASIRSTPIDGNSLRWLAAHAGVELGGPLDVGLDAREIGDLDEPIRVSDVAAVDLCRWYMTCNASDDQRTDGS
jgi:hypothetical protein